MSSSSLSMRWSGGELTVEPGHPATLGRSPDSTVVLNSPAVSRTHARVENDGDTWRVHDLGSTQGSFHDGVAFDVLVVTEPVDVLLGQGPDAVLVTLAPNTMPMQELGEDAFAQPTRAVNGRVVVPAQNPVSPGDAPPAADVPHGKRPGGGLAPVATPPTVVPEPAHAHDLHVRVEGQQRSVAWGQVLRLGREDDNDVVLAEPSVSRRHARIEGQQGGWVLVDTGSRAGTWIGSERVERVELTGRSTVVLGDRTTGARLEIEAPGPDAAPVQQGRRPRWRSTPVLAGALVLVLLVAVGLVALSRRGGLDTDRLARATVQVVYETSEFRATGSGTIIDAKKGLILTNAHVAAPHALGTGVRDGEFENELDANPDTLRISITPGLDRAAQPRFLSKVIAVDGYLDLAVLQITNTLSDRRAAVTEDDLKGLTDVELGSADDLGSGDRITTVGYPAAATSDAPTVTEGVVAGVVADQRLETSRAYLNIDATVSPGNSGGLAADAKGDLVGVPTLVRLDRNRNTVGLASMRPIELALPLITAARTGKAYTSPWVSELPPGAKLTALRDTAAGEEPGEVTATCSNTGAARGSIAFAADYTGFAKGKHTDVLAELRNAGGDAVAVSETPYPTALAPNGCMTLTFDRTTLPDGRYRLIIGAGGNHTVLYDAPVQYSRDFRTTGPGFGND